VFWEQIDLFREQIDVFRESLECVHFHGHIRVR
jgi:hypothetical protein